MQETDIYYIAAILDPRIKTRWLKRHVEDSDRIIERIRAFLNAT